jgi:hypothetical protein
VDILSLLVGVLKAQDPTVEYRCGGCGAVLMSADKNKLHALIIHCTSCDAYNSTRGIMNERGKSFSAASINSMLSK